MFENKKKGTGYRTNNAISLFVRATVFNHGDRCIARLISNTGPAKLNSYVAEKLVPRPDGLLANYAH